MPPTLGRPLPIWSLNSRRAFPCLTAFTCFFVVLCLSCPQILLFWLLKLFHWPSLVLVLFAFSCISDVWCRFAHHFSTRIRSACLRSSQYLCLFAFSLFHSVWSSLIQNLFHAFSTVDARLILNLLFFSGLVVYDFGCCCLSYTFVCTRSVFYCWPWFFNGFPFLKRVGLIRSVNRDFIPNRFQNNRKKKKNL